MGWFERLTGALAPRAALQRDVARRIRAELRALPPPRRGQRYSEAAHFGPGWSRNSGRVEDAIAHVALSRFRVRRLVATNPYAAKVRQTLLNNLIGFGIVGTPAKGAPRKVAEAWQRWISLADWMGRLDFYGLQDLAIGTMLGDGECFIVRRYDRSVSGAVPLRIEIFDADMLARTAAKGGIEYDESGRPTKYHFQKRRAGSLAGVLSETVAFEAKDVIHLFRQDWPGQVRGVSIFEPAIKRFEDMDDYIEAEVVRKKIEACFAAFITPSEEDAATDMALGEIGDEQTGNGYDVEVLEPGMIERLRPGDTIQFGDPKPSAAIAEFARVTLLGATTGAGVPYEHGTGDLSNVNYSSYRAGTLEFQRFCGRLQWLLIIPVMLERIWAWFCEDGYQVGLFGKDWYPQKWTPPAFESIDRGKDAKADMLELQAGLESHREQIAKRGWDFEEKMAEIAEDRATVAGLGLTFSYSESGAAAGKTEGKADDGRED